MEKTLLLIKPDALQRRLVGEIIRRMESRGLRLCALKMTKLDNELLEDHYRHLLDKPFFREIADFMQTSPIIATCWAGLDAVSTVRNMCGVTKARDAAPGTIRGDYAMSIQTNVVHASDSIEAAAEELKRFFRPDEIFDYDDHSLSYIYSVSERG